VLAAHGGGRGVTRAFGADRCIIPELYIVLFYVAIMESAIGVRKSTTARDAREFSFLTNHGKALLLIAHDPRIRIRDIAERLNITERATQRIVADLANAGYIERAREGRRTRYSVSKHLPLGLPIRRDADIGALLAVLPAANGSV